MCMLLLFIHTKCTIQIYLGIFRNYGHDDIFVLKQNLLIIKVSFSFITLKVCKQSKIVL